MSHYVLCPFQKLTSCVTKEWNAHLDTEGKGIRVPIVSCTTLMKHEVVFSESVTLRLQEIRRLELFATFVDLNEIHFCSCVTSCQDWRHSNYTFQLPSSVETLPYKTTRVFTLLPMTSIICRSCRVRENCHNL